MFSKFARSPTVTIIVENQMIRRRMAQADYDKTHAWKFRFGRVCFYRGSSSTYNCSLCDEVVVKISGSGFLEASSLPAAFPAPFRFDFIVKNHIGTHVDDHLSRFDELTEDEQAELIKAATADVLGERITRERITK